MKSKKVMNKHCKFCKKHTEHKVTQAKQSTRSSAHPLSHGSTSRLKRRNERRGFGNLGRYSKPTKPKRTGAKQTKKIVLKLTCNVSKKSYQLPIGRSKKIEFE